ncbi:MAG: 30S ribosomal protein S6 [Parcubacteria group bacterium]
MEYELLFFSSLSHEDKIEEIKKEIQDTITGLGGKISIDWNDIGKRKLAHPIKKDTHAFYSWCRFTTEEKDKIPEMNRALVLNDRIIRHIVVRASEVGKKVDPAQDIQPDTEVKAVEEVKPAIETKPEEKETKPKVTLNELDDKLNEILDETPE